MRKTDDAINAFNHAFGHKVKECRLSMGYSQEYVVCKLQLAGVDMCRQSLSDIELGRRGVEAFVALFLANLLNIDLAHLATYALPQSLP